VSASKSGGTHYFLVPIRPGDDPRTDRADWHATRARPAEASGYVERGGVRIFWETFGSGEPAILILPTWSVLHAAHGRFQIADLARDHRVITFDGSPRSGAAGASSARRSGPSSTPDTTSTWSDRSLV
jgi:hypothetical protein